MFNYTLLKSNQTDDLIVSEYEVVLSNRFKFFLTTRQYIGVPAKVRGDGFNNFNTIITESTASYIDNNGKVIKIEHIVSPNKSQEYVNYKIGVKVCMHKAVVSICKIKLNQWFKQYNQALFNKNKFYFDIK